ncbi:Stress response protein [Actinidia chinensis var. chinensis]|uniref:Stress response protein n=1 Tax=Actinidia chinensis var. chinensis TaxID=1590841 RepID=A0A2R6RSU9_ACTCC|nr:Stress response protein [Actinidia chinensis var. chinensis]
MSNCCVLPFPIPILVVVPILTLLLFSDDSCFSQPIPNMELNQAQLLVHDDATLAQFRADHNIHDDVLIERSSSNEDANLVDEEGNHIPVSINSIWTVLAVDVLMKRNKLKFNIGDLLHVNCIVQPRRDPQIHVYTSNHYLRLWKPHQPQTRLVTNAPDKDFNLIEGTTVELWQLKKETEGQSTDSSGSSSSDSFDLSNEDAGEGVASIVGDEKRTPRSKKARRSIKSKTRFPEVPLVAEDLIKHSFNQGGSLGSNSEEEVDMVPKLRNLGKKKAAKASPAQPTLALVLSLQSPPEVLPNIPSSHVLELWAPKFVVVELGKQVTNADTSRDHETCLALGNVVMLPQDSLQRAVANSDRMKKYSNDLKKANHKTPAFKAELKKVASGEVFERVFNRGYNHAGDSYEKQVAELRPSIFKEGWLVYLKELGAPSDHLAWNALTPPPADEEGVTAMGEVSTTQGNKLGGGEGEDARGAEREDARGAEREDARGAEREGIGEGNLSTSPKE